MFKKDFREVVFNVTELKSPLLLDQIFLNLIKDNKSINIYFFKKNIKEIETKINKLSSSISFDKDVLFDKEKQRLNNVFKEILNLKSDFNDTTEISAMDFVYYVLESDEIKYLNEVLKKNKKIKLLKDSYIISKNEAYDKSKFAIDLIKEKRLSLDQLKKSIVEENEGDDNQESELSKYTVSLNEMVRNNQIKGITGRELEMKSLIRSLSRKDKNNPIILGESGVGKTALVEGLAYLIENNKVNEKLSSFEILSLDVGSLMAGTKYRGDLEKRFKLLIQEILKKENIILFVDEIHSILSPSNAESNQSKFSNLIKPYLSKGKIKIIGATTYDEYSKSIELDPALVRRFNNIELKAPNEKEAIDILISNKKYYEDFHGVKYPNVIIKKMVKLSERYITNKNLPDKGFDLLDEMGVLASEKDKKEVDDLILEEVLKIKIGVDKIKSNNLLSSLKNLESDLNSKIFGQEKVISEMVDAILLSNSGLIEKQKPSNVFLFLGSSGVGKTELTKFLSKSMNMNLIRFDMSEYSNPTSVNKFIGSNSGYVGFENGGLLTNEVSKNPYSVILLDEIEKADASIFNLLLQIFDNGFITDGKGKKVDFRHTIIVLTSNIGLNEENKRTIGFNEVNKDYDVDLEKYLPIEFINRIDEIFKFKNLDNNVVLKIIKDSLYKLKISLKAKDINLVIDDKIVDEILKNNYDKRYGARPIKKYIDKTLTTKIAKFILLNDIESGSNLNIFLNNKEITIS